MGGLGPIGDRGRCEESKSSLRIVGLRSITPATLVGYRTGSGKRGLGSGVGVGSSVEGAGGRVRKPCSGSSGSVLVEYMLLKDD